MKNHLLLGGAAAFLLCSTLLAATARAEGAGSQAAAQALFDEGRKLMEAGKYADACPKLESSQKLDPGAGTLMNLAACYEKSGQTASAWVTYTDAASAAAGRHPDWVETARQHVATLEPKLCKLTVDVRAKATGLVVKRDGAVLPEGMAGAPIPVDPGKHTVEATAPGHAPFTVTIELMGDAARKTVVVRELDATGATGASEPGGLGGAKIAGLTMAGVGAAGLVVGAVFGGLALGAKGTAGDGNCSSDLLHCNAKGIDALDSARTFATVSTIGFIGGGVLLAGGIVLFLAAPKKEAAPAVSVSLGHEGTLGLTLGGTF
ncbi:MAG TPA: hypothetical protein VF316_25675 [Polyangiaceae bacterium]